MMGNKKGLIRIMAAVFLLSFLLLISGREVLAEVIFDDMKYSLNETDKTAEGSFHSPEGDRSQSDRQRRDSRGHLMDKCQWGRPVCSLWCQMRQNGIQCDEGPWGRQEHMDEKETQGE